MSVQRVVVVGGGVAGITAALDCAERGAQVTLLEVRPRLGGAAYSIDRDGLQLDNGQHVFLRCCSAYRGLLERIGGAGGVELQERLEIPVLCPGQPDAALRRGVLPAPLHLTGALLRYPHLPFAARLSAGRTALAIGRLDPTTDDTTFGAWLSARGQSTQAVANLWDLIALPTLNIPAAEASLGLAAFVFQEGLLRSAAAGDIGIHRAPLSEIVGKPAAQALAQAGVSVELGWRATAIASAGSGFEVRGERGTHACGGVILAVPHERAAALLPTQLRDEAPWIGRLGRSPIVNLHVVYDRHVFDHRFAAGVESPVQYLFDRTPAEWAGQRRQYVAISLSGAIEEAAMSPAALRERYLPALAALLPRASGAAVERFAVTREHSATFRAAPGVRALRPSATTSLPGFALAGAWTATDWPATLEGAARSGHAAAAVVLGDGGEHAGG